jgi:4-hydroxy-4-methyl-2-oxoglutarate aldolase
MSHMKKYISFLSFLLCLSICITAQQVTPTPDEIKAMTPKWKGERFPDGRPKVPDKLLERLKKVHLEEAWGILRSRGYQNQFEGDWIVEHTDSAMTGRAVTAQYMPLRPDYDTVIRNVGKAEKRIGNTNSWPIDVLKDGDIYVADSYGKIVDGTLIGDNLGNAIYAKSHRGVIFYGSVRDVDSWTKGNDPSYIQQMMLGGINVPIRIGRATVLPGDAVLAKKYGVVFIPAHLLEDVVLNAEFISLRDQFGHQRLREQKYTPGQIDTQWTDEIKKDFLKWLDDNPEKLPMSREELDKFMKDRTW